MSKQRKGGLLDGVDLSKYRTEEDSFQPTSSKKNLLDGVDLSKYSSQSGTDSVSTEEPSKKKVDTGLSGTTSFLDSSFKAKGPLFDSKEELTRLGKIEGALTPEERAQRAEDARQQKIAEDKLTNYKRSVIYDAVSNAAELGGISKPFFAGIVDAGAGMVGLAGLLSNFRPSGLSTAEYVNRKLEEERAGVQPTETASLQEERYGKKASTNIAYETAAEMSGLSGALTKETEKSLGVSEEDLAKGPVDLITEGKLGSGLKVLAVEIVKSIPNVIVQSALAPEAGVGFLAQKAATFATTTATSLGSNIAQDYAQDKDISSDDILKGIAKSAIEGLTESFFMGDIKAVKGIGASLVKGETTAAKELLKGVIEKEGKEAAKQEIARGFSKPLAKMLGKGFEGASVVGQFNKGGVEEGIEEVMSTVGSFIVDRVADGNWSDADYNQLVKDASNAFVLGYGSGGLMNGVAAQLSMKKLTDEQKAKVEKFNEVANNEELSAEVRKIARDKANDIIRESADQSYAGYDELTRLPVEKRVQAFSLLSDINAQEESKKNVKDVDMIAAIDKSIEAKKADYDYLLTGVKPSTQPVVEKAPATEEEKQTAAKIQTEEQAYQEELAKADKSWKETIGMPSEPMKVSSQFSIRANPEELGVNNAHEPSPNMPLEVDKKADGKKVQFTTKENPDALLEGDVYTINQGNKKFATILSANRNGVQEYYVPELPDAKPFANLDDAKFAVQEKLTGIRVKEIERSGINRLRADQSIPKADIVVRTDNGQEVLLDPVAKKSIQNAIKAFKSVSNAPVYLYRNTEDFKKGVAKELGSESKALESAGQVGGGFFTNARNEDSIHINLANISATTVAHELFHGTVVNVARQNPSAFAEMRDAIINKLGENDLINVSDEKGKLVKLSAKEYLDRYSKQYSPEQQAEEFLSELTGLLATDMAKLKDPTIWETIKLAIRNLVKTANIDIPIFEKTANINDTVKFFTDLSKSLKTGQEIKLEKLKIQNDKEAVKQGTAVQATNGESQIAEEDESLRDSVSKTVTQRRKGNELGKKKRKLSAVAAKAMAIEPTTPDDYALQYFINGGQVIRGSKDDTAEKDTVFSLFSKSRMGGAKESVSEMRARVRIMAGRDAGGLSISEIAEKIFAEYQQATKGDVGIDVNTQYDFMDFKNAVESAILGHKSDTAMANTLLESKNKPAEEGAIALTEEQELEALRIKAEAQALGLTEEEFMAKLAELQDTPEMQAAEEAYAQALDMIDDEDFAKLYEINDDDIAKIDELMAGVESTEGALDDKLAEQKKIVRDLEAERKKVLAAIDKAGKEKQLDIEGKAPIQEQLFATDTKSLTDRLQSIETQLTAAKADVAATQSAIDFQERGTVDMFEEEVKPEVKAEESKPTKPAKEDKIQAEIKSIQGEIEQYEREIEDALEEIENTKYNYNETVKEIALEKMNAKAAKLSRDEKADKLEELKAQVEDAADERDDYIEQYKEQITDAKSEIKKLNKSLAKLQEQQNASKATVITEEPITPRIQTKEEAINKIEQERADALKKAPLYPLNFNEPNYEKNKAKFESEKIKEINDSYDAKISTVNSFFARKGKFQKQGISVAPKSVGAIYNKYPNVVLDVFVSDSKKEISLDRIIVPKEDRNKGIGTNIVNDLTRYADANGYRINLTPSGDFGGSKDRLTKFYKGFGFVENKGKNKDFSTKELMYRLPLEKPNEEEINAEFSSTRDNTPIGFNYDTDLVARERFNIPALKRIGEGSDRVVFDLGDGNVLKVAKTARGLAQNIYEGSYDLVEEGILPEVLETGLNYIVAEKVEPAKGNKAVNELVRQLKNFNQRDFDMRTPKLQDVLEANDLSYVMNYDVLYGDLSAARNWGVKNGKPIHLDGGTFGGVQMLQQYRGVKNLNDNDFREVYYKSRQAKAKFGDTDKFTKFQKQGISVAPAYKYQMNEMFKDPQRLTKDIEAKYDIRTVLRERGKIEGTIIEAERAITDNIVLGALSRVSVLGFKTIGAIENAPLFKAGTGRTVKLKEALTGWSGYTANGLRSATLKAIQSNNKYAASTGRIAASLIGNLAKSDILQEQRALRSGSQLDANNSIAMLSKGLNGMIGFDERALMRVHSLLDPEAFIENEDAVTSPRDLSLQELRLYNTLRDINDFIHEWHFQNEFIDAPTYEKHKGKYFARMYAEIEKKEFADLNEAIDKMPSGADFRMFKERKDFSEVELTLMNDPIYITSRRLATMLHNKATLEFCNAMANDPSYKIYKKLDDVPENNKKGFKLLDSKGGGKRYGELTNKYVPIALYEELRGTTFATEFISKSYDVLRMYDGLSVRKFLKKTKTLYNPTTRLGNITTNFAFAWLAGVDPFTMMKNRVRAKDSLDNYDEWAKDLALAGVLGTDTIVADLTQKKNEKEKSENVIRQAISRGYDKSEDAVFKVLKDKLGISEENIAKTKKVREEMGKKRKQLDDYMLESYGRTDDVSKISLYRSLVEDYGKSKEEAIRIVGESMQNYATVGKAYQFFSKLPLVGNPFVKFSSDMARIVANGFANRPLYMASFLGMMYGVARLLSNLSGEPEDEREARESRAFIPKIPLGFTDIPLTWKVGKYEVNAARFISPYYVYDAGYRSNTVAELTKFAPIQLSYSNKVGFASDYMPVLSDPFIAPLAQVAFDKDFRGLPIADPNGSQYTRQTVTEGEAIWNRFNYLGHSYASPIWGYVANLYSAAKGQGDLYGRRRDIPSAILNSVIKVQEIDSKDIQKAVINQVKYIDSEYKQIKTDITSRRNDDVEKIQEIIGSEATESQKEEQIMNVKINYSNYVEEMVGKMQELKVDREVPMDRLYKLQHPKKND